MRLLAALLALGLAATPASTTPWTLRPDAGVRVPQGVSTEAVAIDGGGVRLYVTGAGGMAVYRSSDGLAFAPEAASTPAGSDAAVVRLADGGWRMYFVTQSPAGKVVRSARSSDGLAWTTEPGDRFAIGAGPAGGVPEAVSLPGGGVRIYYVAAGIFPEQILSATSADGLSFVPDAGIRLSGGYVDPAVERLADGSWLMLLSTSPLSRQRLYTATSADGLAWKVASAPLPDATGRNDLDPTLLPLGGDRFRVYYSTADPGNALSGPYRVESGTLEPAPPPATPSPQQPKPKRTPKKKRKP